MDIRKIKTLIELLEGSDVTEIEICEGEESVRISRGHVQPVYAAPAVPVPVAAPAPAAAPVATAATDAPKAESTAHPPKRPRKPRREDTEIAAAAIVELPTVTEAPTAEPAAESIAPAPIATPAAEPAPVRGIPQEVVQARHALVRGLKLPAQV